MPTALVTGASAGFGAALTRALADRGWQLVVDARRPDRLQAFTDSLSPTASVVGIAGDVSDPAHRAALADAVAGIGSLALLVNNASTLGPTPLPPLSTLPVDGLAAVYDVNVVAPLALIQTLLPALTENAGTVVNLSSDAAVDHYPGWGAYGAAKAALDHVTLTLAAENPAVHWYAVDPGDMRTQMHQAAFPGEDISDRPEPETVVPALLALLDARPRSGRYRAADFAPADPATQGVRS